MSYLRRVEAMLDESRAQQRYREISPRHLSGVVDFSSNDYLGLATEPQVVAALERATRVGAGGARLLGGAHRDHALLEEELAGWLGRERALLFSSGYHAAIGAIPVLAETVTTILSDERNHASLIDGMRLARTPRRIYDHLGVPPAGEAALIVTESLFSMDGDAIDLPVLTARLGPDDILLVDEAHALGVAGAEGGGIVRQFDDPRLVVMGTLSKAIGAHGGFIAGPGSVIELLINRARSFIFDTALPPAIALAARIGLMLTRRAGDRRERLHANVARLRDGLCRCGFDVPAPAGAIVPLVLGSEERALRVASELRERHVLAPAVRPPTVPAGSSRLRFSVRADHTSEQIDLAVEAVRRCIAIS